HCHLRTRQQAGRRPQHHPVHIAHDHGGAVRASGGSIFIGGYFAYVAMATVFGAVTENTRQASRISFLLTTVAMSLLVWMINVLSAPEGALALFLSLFPLSSPVIMPLRIFTSDVPLWQVLLSFALLIGWTALMLWLSARLFSVRLLLHSQPLRAMVWGRVKQLTGKAAAGS
ncbi:MAG: ABC transporter permease, partial [Chloroflexota bacterium]